MTENAIVMSDVSSRFLSISPIWTFTEGRGELIIDGDIRTVGRGDTVEIKSGTKHAIKGITELHIIEVQIGDELTEDDIERLDWDWSHNGNKGQ